MLTYLLTYLSTFFIYLPSDLLTLSLLAGLTISKAEGFGKPPVVERMVPPLMGGERLMSTAREEGGKRREEREDGLDGLLCRYVCIDRSPFSAHLFTYLPTYLSTIPTYLTTSTYLPVQVR